MRDNLKVCIMKTQFYQRHHFHELVMTNKHGCKYKSNTAAYIKALSITELIIMLDVVGGQYVWLVKS